jgi:hypothetical protein
MGLHRTIGGGVSYLAFIIHIFYNWAHNVRQCEICYIFNA